jgi:hypothetical protein
VFRLAPDIMLLQRLGVTGIILILIYSLYRKKEISKLQVLLIGQLSVCTLSILGFFFYSFTVWNNNLLF